MKGLFDRSAVVVWLFVVAFFNLLCLPSLSSSQTVTPAAPVGPTDSPTASGAQSTTAPVAASPPVTSDPTAAATLMSLQTALTAAQTALTSALTDETAALAIIGSLPSGQPTLATSTVDAIDKAAATLGDKTKVPSAKAMTDLDARLQTDINATASTGLPTLQTNLQTALANANAIAAGMLTAGDQQKLTSAITDANAALSSLTLIIADIKKNILPTNSAGVVSDITAAAKFAQTLADMLQKAESANSVFTADSKATATALRTALTAGLHDLMSDEQIRIQLAKDWPTDSAAFTNALTSFSDGVQPDLTTLQKGIEDPTTGLLARWDPWLKALSGDAASTTTNVGKSVTAMLQTLNQPQRDMQVVATANDTHNSAYQESTDIENILTDARTLFTFWESGGYKSNLAAAETSLTALQKAEQELAGQTALLGGYLEGDVEHFVQDQVRLFYYSDVPRLLRAINYDGAQLYTPTEVSQAQQALKNAQTDLQNQESAVAALNEEINSHKQQVSTLTEAVRLATAQLADANNRKQAAQSKLNSLNNQQTSNQILRERLTAQQTTLTNLQTALQTQQTALNTQLATATASTAPNKAATIASLQQQIQTNQNQQASVTKQSNAVALQLASIPPDPVANGAIATAQQAQLTQANNDITSISADIDNYKDQLAKLGPQLTAAKQDLIDAQVRRGAAKRIVLAKN